LTATGSYQDQDARLSYAERRKVFAERMMECVSFAFFAIGTSPAMEDYIYWKLSLGLNEVVDKPQKFMEGLREIFGEAGAAVYEGELVKAVQKEFGLVRAPGSEERTRHRPLGELLQAAVTAAWMCPQPERLASQV